MPRQGVVPRAQVATERREAIEHRIRVCGAGDVPRVQVAVELKGRAAASDIADVPRAQVA